MQIVNHLSRGSHHGLVVADQQAKAAVLQCAACPMVFLGGSDACAMVEVKRLLLCCLECSETAAITQATLATQRQHSL
jgi:hypothetical protein